MSALWTAPGDRRPLFAEIDGGERIFVRPLEPGDAQALQDGFERLSDRSRMFRFLRARPELTGAERIDLVSPDRTSHDAIGALRLGGVRDVPAGVARYYEMGGGAAEFALTVVDDSQARGLGTFLLACLAGVAADRGLRQFMALVHPRNGAMLHILRDLGAVWASRGPDAQEIVLPLHRDPARYPATRSGDVFRRVHALRLERDISDADSPEGAC